METGLGWNTVLSHELTNTSLVILTLYPVSDVVNRHGGISGTI